MNNINQLLKEGIYFNMPEEQYFALPYFSRSLAQKVRFSGEEAEYYLKNPMKKTPAMDLGTAIHCMMLEPEKFENTYIKAPSITDEIFSGKKIIQTVEDLKPYLEMFGLKKSGKKEDLIESVRGYLNPAEVVIWDDIKSNFDREVESQKKIVLSSDDFQNLVDINEKFSDSKETQAVKKNGRSEVVIVWKDRESGILCKCRLDYLSIESIVDIKSFSIKDFNTPLLDQLRKKTVLSYYNFQYAVYLEALETVIEAVNAGTAEIHGETDQEWINLFLKNPKKEFLILYIRTSAPYQMQILQLQIADVDGATENAYFSVAKNIWRNSIKKYANFLKTGQWLNEGNIEVLRDSHVPNVMWQQTQED